jgi:hypothetical protein
VDEGAGHGFESQPPIINPRSQKAGDAAHSSINPRMREVL